MRRFETAAAFAETAMLYLLEHEAEHGLMIGLLAGALEDPSRWDQPITYVAVEQAGIPVLVSMRTPPHNPILSRVTELAAIPFLVDCYLEQEDVHGLLAPPEAGELFAHDWTARSGQWVEIAMRERIYAVERVIPVMGGQGELRAATDADRALLIDWNEAFVSEAFGEHAVSGQAARSVQSGLAGSQSGFGIWEDEGPVCLVGWGGPTPNGIRIGPVYTPVEHRGKGYASAATVAVSQTLLDAGRRFCMLFADLGNPTSNGIYQRIGYEAVADVTQYRFTR